MNIISKILTLILLSFTLMLNNSIAQHSHSGHSDNKQTKKNVDHPAEGEELPSGLSQMNHKEHNHTMMDSSKTKNESWVREGEIDIEAIDKNNDGKVFQDQMDWNVISDEPGECPLCGMKLKEVTLDKAKENLVKHNFKVKEE